MAVVVGLLFWGRRDLGPAAVWALAVFDVFDECRNLAGCAANGDAPQEECPDVDDVAKCALYPPSVLGFSPGWIV